MKFQIIKVVNYINLLSIIYLTASSIHYYAWQKIAFFVFFISYLIELFLEKKWQSIIFDKKHVYFMVMLFFFFMAFLYFPFENSSKYTRLLLDKRYPLLGFGLVGLFGVNKLYKLNYFLNTIIITSFVSIIYLLFFDIGIIEFLNNPYRNELFSAERIKHVNSHMIFNFYLNLSSVSIWYILTQTWKQTIWWKRYLYIGAFSINFLTLSISEGRSGFIISILLMLSFIFVEIWKRKKVVGIVLGLLIPFILIGIASQHKRLSKNMIETEPRLFLWHGALTVVEENPIFGYGINDAQEKFDVARTKFQTEEFRVNSLTSKHLDSHDQYLQTTMEFGVLGFIILLFLYIYPIIITHKNRTIFAFFLMLMCAYQSIFDMFVTGPFSLIFGLLTIILLSVENDNEVHQKIKAVE
jgi:O-antigen ligase